jgi:hypothetical protein
MNKKLVALVLATAVIAGATLGSIVGYRHYSQQATASPNHATVKTEKKKPDYASQPAAVPTTAALPATDQANSELTHTVEDSMGNHINMTEIEVSEVEKMLSVVGVPTDKKYSQRIEYFQKVNKMTTSGILDQQTLKILIKQATQKLADQRIGSGQ